MSLKRRTSDGLNGCVRVYEPQPIRLANINTLLPLAINPSVVAVRVPTPDARVQVKIAIYAASDLSSPAAVPPTIPYDVLDGGVLSVGLWLSSRETDEGTGLDIPVTDLVGTNAVPQAIPLDVGLMGYSETVAQQGDSVWAVLTFDCAGGGALNLFEDWWIQVSYQPIVEMSSQEWAQLIQYFNPNIRGLLINNNA